MLSFIRSQPVVRVGLLLHHARLHLVKLKRCRQRDTLLAFASTTILAADGSLSQSIEELVKATHSENCCASLGIPATNVMQKRLHLSACLSDAECAAEVSEKIIDYLPGMSAPLNMDCVVWEPQGDKNEILLVAARSEHISRYVLAAEQASLKVRVVDVDVYALARVFEKKHSGSSSLFIILEIDEFSAQFILLERKKVTAVHAFLIDKKEMLAAQLKRALSLFCVSASLKKVEKIFLTGEWNVIHQIREIFQKEMGISSEISYLLQDLNLAKGINLSEFHVKQSELITTYGLAMRNIPLW